MNANSNEFYLGRQPILDRAEQLHAFELLFRSGPTNRADIVDGVAATAQVIQHAFGELGAEVALGPFRGFINIDASMLMNDVLELLPRHLVTLELLETIVITPDVVARCKELKQAGFKLALDDVREITAPYHPMLEIVDYLKVDIKLVAPTELVELTQQARAWPVALLAEKVDTREEAAHCRELGYQYFQGYYFARPLLIPGKKLSPSETILMRLLALLLNDADTDDIEALIRQSPPLTLNLLRIVNAAAVGLSRKLASIGDAITVLGRRQLKRWVQ
jgi:EAL and modified HD-GYP domain-containing signal transduction protein